MVIGSQTREPTVAKRGGRAFGVGWDRGPRAAHIPRDGRRPISALAAGGGNGSYSWGSCRAETGAGRFRNPASLLRLRLHQI
jgi:hypothetical protein